MIDPNRREKQRPGIQGQLRYDPANINSNVPLFNAVKKFMAGPEGLGELVGLLLIK